MNENAFSYTYSAAANQEVLAIRQKYLPREETKLDELKRLDRLVRASGVSAALTVGVLSSLLFGTGLCLAMEIIGNLPWLGVLLMPAGIGGMLTAYPIHRKAYTKNKQQYAPRILELAAELTNQ